MIEAFLTYGLLPATVLVAGILIIKAIQRSGEKRAYERIARQREEENNHVRELKEAADRIVDGSHPRDVARRLRNGTF